MHGEDKLTFLRVWDNLLTWDDFEIVAASGGFQNGLFCGKAGFVFYYI